MKIEQLLEELEDIKKIHGNIEVVAELGDERFSYREIATEISGIPIPGELVCLL